MCNFKIQYVIKIIMLKQFDRKVVNFHRLFIKDSGSSGCRSQSAKGE